MVATAACNIAFFAGKLGAVKTQLYARKCWTHFGCVLSLEHCRKKGATTLSITTFSLTTLSISTLSITTLSIMTLSNTTLRITTISIMTFYIPINKSRHSAQLHSALWQSFVMLNVTYKPFVLIVVMLSVIRLNAVMLSVVVPKKALVAAANSCQCYKTFFLFFVAATTK